MLRTDADHVEHANEGHTGIALNQHHVGGHRADHGPKHAPEMISSEGCRMEKPINRSKNKTAVRRPKSHVQNCMTGKTPLPKS